MWDAILSPRCRGCEIAQFRRAGTGGPAAGPHGGRKQTRPGLAPVPEGGFALGLG